MNITEAILITSPILFLSTAFLMIKARCFHIKSKMIKVKIRHSSKIQKK